MLYRLVQLPQDGITLCDIGNTRIGDTLEATHDIHSHIVEQIIRDDKRLIVLGGGNDISYPDCAGLARAAGQVAAFNVDAHFDVRADTPPNSGTPYRQLLEERYIQAKDFYEIGANPFSNSSIYRKFLRDAGVCIVDLFALREQGILKFLHRVLAEYDSISIFWGLDMDVVNAADAPGVSAPNALGLTSFEFCQIAALAGQDKRTRLLEISEVNPAYDIDSRTSRLAAAAIWQYLSHIPMKLPTASGVVSSGITA
jgi:formiminoglutamase